MQPERWLEDHDEGPMAVLCCCVLPCASVVPFHGCSAVTVSLYLPCYLNDYQSSISSLSTAELAIEGARAHPGAPHWALSLLQCFNLAAIPCELEGPCHLPSADSLGSTSPWIYKVIHNDMPTW